MRKLHTLAKVVRSKNAGPFHFTLDIIFETAQDYQRFMEVGAITPAWVAKNYGVREDDVAIIPYPPAHALKITIPRLATSGSPEDRDVYGAQQHGPLLELEIPDA